MHSVKKGMKKKEKKEFVFKIAIPEFRRCFCAISENCLRLNKGRVRVCLWNEACGSHFSRAPNTHVFSKISNSLRWLRTLTECFPGVPVWLHLGMQLLTGLLGMLTSSRYARKVKNSRDVNKVLILPEMVGDWDYIYIYFHTCLPLPRYRPAPAPALAHLLHPHIHLCLHVHLHLQLHLHLHVHLYVHLQPYQHRHLHGHLHLPTLPTPAPAPTPAAKCAPAWTPAPATLPAPTPARHLHAHLLLHLHVPMHKPACALAPAGTRACS